MYSLDYTFLDGGVYTVLARLTGVNTTESTDEVVIDVQRDVSITIDSPVDGSTVNDEVSFSVTTSGEVEYVEYQITKDGGDTEIGIGNPGNGNGFDYTFSEGGNYTVVAKAYGLNGSESSDQISLTSTVTGLNSEVEKGAVQFYPNPCVDIIHVNSLRSFNYTIINAQGNVVLKGTSESSINTSDLASGMYVLQIDTAEGLQTTSFVK